MIMSALLILAAVLVAADTILTIMFADNDGYINKKHETARALKKAILYSMLVVATGVFIIMCL